MAVIPGLTDGPPGPHIVHGRFLALRMVAQSEGSGGSVVDKRSPEKKQ